MHPHLEDALSKGFGAIARRDHPTLTSAMDAALRRGELVAVLAGVYARPVEAGTLKVRARAACLADPDAVVTGRAAAILGGWEVPHPSVVTVASQRIHGTRPGFRFERRRIPRSLWRTTDGLRIAVRALAALDVAVELGDSYLDDALRRSVEPAQLRRALDLGRGRRGFGRLRPAVLAIRDRPWSPVERTAHELLRAAHVEGWLANRAVADRHDDLLGYGDLVFPAFDLVIEIDGRSFHDPAADAARDLRFACAGWEVIRMGSDLVTHHPQRFVAHVRDILRTREWRRRRPGPR